MKKISEKPLLNAANRGFSASYSPAGIYRGQADYRGLSCQQNPRVSAFSVSLRKTRRLAFGIFCGGNLCNLFFPAKRDPAYGGNNLRNHKDRIFRSSLLKLAIFVLTVGLFMFNTNAGEALDIQTGLSQTNQQITLLYIDALNFHKEGQYDKAANAVEHIFKLLESDLYVSSIRRSLKIQPDEVTLRAFLDKIKKTDVEYQKAKTAFNKGKYAQAAQIFIALKGESPQGKDIQRYIEKTERLIAKQPLREETSKSEFVYQSSQDERAIREALLSARKQDLSQQEELIRKKEELLKKIAGEQERQEQELLSKQERLAKEKEEELNRVIQAKKEKEKQLRAQEEGLSREREALKAKIDEIKKSAVQEMALTEAILKKQREDEAKVIKIEKIWREARKLYAQGMYEEAIKRFEEVVTLEGNPRIKYTPYAKEYIEKSKEKIIEKKQSNLSTQLEHKEKEMISEVLNRQIPPYVEPPPRMTETPSVPLIEPPPVRKKLKTSKVNLEFDKVDLKSAMLFLSKESGVNLIASQKVLELAPKVSVRFTDAPVEEVIKYIVKSLGLVYRIDKDVVWIAHPDEIASEPLETRVYYLTRGGGLFAEFTPITAGGGTETGLGSSSAQFTKLYTIEDTLKEIIPWPADAKLTYDKRINALIVRNTPQNLQMLEDIIYNLDVVPYQVLIEARFLEVDITDTKELGFEWKFTTQDFPLRTKRGQDAYVIAKDSGVDFNSFTRAAEGLNLTYKGLLSAPQFETVLHALEETKKIKTLSSPRITTLNNQPATIKVVDEWIYPTRYEYEVVQSDINGDGDFSDAGETTYKNVPKDFIRRDVGILLKVIPSVGADKKTINLSLIPEVSEATADAFTYTGDVKLPKFTSRNLSTTVVVNSGDTVVLGGLIRESRTKTTTRVPFLGSIPIIGNLFKKDSDSIQRKNLLIFVTAKVLTPAGEEIVTADK